jgi:hypothetical protein
LSILVLASGSACKPSPTIVPDADAATPTLTPSFKPAGTSPDEVFPAFVGYARDEQGDMAYALMVAPYRASVPVGDSARAVQAHPYFYQPKTLDARKQASNDNPATPDAVIRSTSGTRFPTWLSKKARRVCESEIAMVLQAPEQGSCEGAQDLKHDGRDAMARSVVSGRSAPGSRGGWSFRNAQASTRTLEHLLSWRSHLPPPPQMIYVTGYTWARRSIEQPPRWTRFASFVPWRPQAWAPRALR